MKRTNLLLAGIILLCVLGFSFLYKTRPTIKTVPSDSTRQNNTAVTGVFEGRTPCGPVIRGVNAISEDNCERVKIRLTISEAVEDSGEKNFQLETIYVGKGDTRYVKDGKLVVTHGTKIDPNATVYQLKLENSSKTLSLLKADNNLLLFLDSNLELLVGTAGESYTLNRTDK